MMERIRKMLRRERGQGMTEYIIIVALIAIAAIGIVTVFGNNIRALFTASSKAITGETGVTPDFDKDFAKGGKKTLKDFSKH